MFRALGDKKLRQTDDSGGDLTQTEINDNGQYVEIRKAENPNGSRDDLARIHEDQWMIKRNEDAQFRTDNRGSWLKE